MKAPRLSRRDAIRALGFGLGSGAVGSFGIDQYVDWLELTHTTVRLKNWQTPGFRIGVLADMHLNTVKQRLRGRRACEMVASEKPDVIVVVGDFINFTRKDINREFKEVFSPLEEAACPVLGVLGNHDYWSLYPQHVIEALKATPVRLLRNEVVEVDGVQIAGLDDAIVNRHRFDSLPSDGPVVALLHEPDFVDEIPNQVSLQISGHSHGGQVCWPGGAAIKPPPYGEKYIAGFFPETNAPLFVARGVGTTGPDFRAFCRPEIAILRCETIG